MTAVLALLLVLGIGIALDAWRSTAPPQPAPQQQQPDWGTSGVARRGRVPGRHRPITTFEGTYS